jgi:hypothetical protein
MSSVFHSIKFHANGSFYIATNFAALRSALRFNAANNQTNATRWHYTTECA